MKWLRTPYSLAFALTVGHCANKSSWSQWMTLLSVRTYGLNFSRWSLQKWNERAHWLAGSKCFSACSKYFARKHFQAVPLVPATPEQQNEWNAKSVFKSPSFVSVPAELAANDCKRQHRFQTSKRKWKVGCIYIGCHTPTNQTARRFPRSIIDHRF